MNLRQCARYLAAIPALLLAVLIGAGIGAPDRILPALKQLWPGSGRSASRHITRVAGMVMKDGQPLPQATIRFHTADGEIVIITAAHDGRYSAWLPEGETSIYIDPEDIGFGLVQTRAGKKKPPIQVTLTGKEKTLDLEADKGLATSRGPLPVETAQ